MPNYNIGISGIQVAQYALDVIGNNLANAATEGYHRQRVDLSPTYSVKNGDFKIGQGVEIKQIKRQIDELLEDEIVRQQSAYADLDRTKSTLSTIETMFGELTTQGFSTALDEFLGALQTWSSQPQEATAQQNVVTKAQSLALQVRRIGGFLTETQDQLFEEAQSVVEQVNSLSTQIARLNQDIFEQEVSGIPVNNLRDERDKAMMELAELVPLDPQRREQGKIDLIGDGLVFVVGTHAMEYEVTQLASGDVAIKRTGDTTYQTSLTGGQLGAVMTLKNSTIKDLLSDFNTLTTSIITEFNKIQSQGVGSEGSFSELMGWSMPTTQVNQWTPALDISAAQNLYITVTDENVSPPTTVRNSITINPTDTLTDVAASINGLSNITASVSASKLYIQADAGYKFDFRGGVIEDPTATTLTGTAEPTISGVYTGSSDITYTCTVVGSGNVGIDSGLQLQITDGGTMNKFIDIGAGYVAGTPVMIDEGIYVEMSAGSVAAGDDFEIEALSDSDPAGFLGAAGMNVLFKGTDSNTMYVDDDIVETPGLLACSRGMEGIDNNNVLDMIEMMDTGISDLDGKTFEEFYRIMNTDLAQKTFMADMQEENTGALMKNLMGRQDETSGVNINNEATGMLLYEQMFQSMAKFITTVDESVQTLLSLVG